jgi:hypothetical protein
MDVHGTSRIRNTIARNMGVTLWMVRRCVGNEQKRDLEYIDLTIIKIHDKVYL